MVDHVQEADGPEGRFVIRAEPHGVSMNSRLFGYWWFGHIRRFFSGDRSWVVRVRTRDDDPTGRPAAEVEVPRRADLAAAMALAEERIRKGQVFSSE